MIMKKRIYLFIAFVVLIGFQNEIYAQKGLSEGKVIYTITYPDMEMDPQMVAMMPTESVVFFKGAMSRTDLSMGMGISSSSIMNSKTGEIVALTDMMGSKSAMKMTTDELKKSKNQNKTPDPVITITNETKEIAGYKCKKAIVKNADNTQEIYYTDEINSISAATLDWKEIKGFPMEYSIDQNGLKMKFAAKSVTPEKVADTIFVIPADYKMVTQEEMMKKMTGGE